MLTLLFSHFLADTLTRAYVIFSQETFCWTIALGLKVNALFVTMSSYWAKRRRILKGVEKDKQEIAAANSALLAVIPDFDQVKPPVNDHGMATTNHGQTGSSIETTDDDKKGKRKRISNSKYRPQTSSGEEEFSLPDAPAVLSFRQPLLSFENIVPSNKVSVLPDAPEVASISENQDNFGPSVEIRVEPGFSPVIQTPLHKAKSLSTRNLMGYSPQQFLDERCRAHQVLSFTPPAANLPWQHMGENAGDIQRLQNENKALREENKALREENQALRESNSRADSDGSGSLQEQVKEVGTMLMTFARAGQSGAEQTLMLRRLGEFGDVMRSMDNKMDTMLQHFSANVSVGELSLPGDLLLPLDTQEDLVLLDNSLRQDKELQE